MKPSFWLITLVLSLVFLGLMAGCGQSVAPTVEKASSAPVEAIPLTCKVYAVQLNNPTMAQVTELLRKDLCDRCKGNCVDRAQCLVTNSYTQGIEAYVVTLNDETGRGHVIVGYQTTDKGFVCIEPLYDMVVTVKVGEDYGKQIDEPGFVVTQIGVFP
jgi:hypothetical protein